MIYIIMKTKDRLKLFVKSINMGQNAFEKEVGIANGYLASKSQTVSSDIVEKIIAKYPDLSLDWLFRGEGKMYKSEMAEDETPMVIKGESGFMILDMPVETFCNELIANTRMFREQLILANERNQILKDEIERLQQLREKQRG